MALKKIGKPKEAKPVGKGNEGTPQKKKEELSWGQRTLWGMNPHERETGREPGNKARGR